MQTSLSTAVEQSYLVFFRPSIRATRSVVFAALTDAGHLRAAFGKADADLRSGGFIRWHDAFEGGLVGGSLLEWTPSESFVLAHEPSGGYFEFKFLQQEGRTVVDVRFFATGQQPRPQLDLLARRTAWFLANVKAHLETGKALDPEAWGLARPAAQDLPRVVRKSDLQWESAGYPDDPEVMGDYANLTRRVGARQIGADIHRLPPGHRSCRYHAETGEEEAFFVVSGRCKAEIEGVVHELAAGDFLLTFPGDAHFFFNDSAEPCEILMFGGPDLPHEGAVYPLGRDSHWRERTGGRQA